MYILDDDIGGRYSDWGDVAETVSDEVVHEEGILGGELHLVDLHQHLLTCTHPNKKILWRGLKLQFCYAQSFLCFVQ